jgi:antitoxin ParD1/3/4
MPNDGSNVSLTERYWRFIDAQVETGRHASSSEVVRQALRRYERDIEAERAAIDALFAIAEKSEAGEAAGDFIDIRDQAHLDDVIQQMLDETVKRGRARQRR